MPIAITVDLVEELLTALYDVADFGANTNHIVMNACGVIDQPAGGWTLGERRLYDAIRAVATASEWSPD